jgi:hypothetical protein
MAGRRASPGSPVLPECHGPGSTPAALSVDGVPTEVITDQATALVSVIEGLVPAALYNIGQ